MHYYIECNLNRLQDRTAPSSRHLHQRGRSTTRRKYTHPPPPKKDHTPTKNGTLGSHHTAEINTKRKTTPNRSSNPDDLIYCEIYGNYHRSSNAGCPHMIRQYNVEQYMKSTSTSAVREKNNTMRREGSQRQYRGQSHESRRSNRSISSNARRG